MGSIVKKIHQKYSFILQGMCSMFYVSSNILFQCTILFQPIDFYCLKKPVTDPNKSCVAQSPHFLENHNLLQNETKSS